MKKLLLWLFSTKHLIYLKHLEPKVFFLIMVILVCDIWIGIIAFKEAAKILSNREGEEK